MSCPFLRNTAAVLFLAAAFAAVQPSPVLAADKSLEYKLACLDAGKMVPEDAIEVARFRSLLKQLDAKYVESQTQIGDMTVRAQELLRDEGVAESMLRMMEGMNRLFTTPLENQKYAEYIAAYITLRGKGNDHDEAVGGIKAILSAAGVR